MIIINLFTFYNIFVQIFSCLRHLKASVTKNNDFIQLGYDCRKLISQLQDKVNADTSYRIDDIYVIQIS